MAIYSLDYIIWTQQLCSTQNNILRGNIGGDQQGVKTDWGEDTVAGETPSVQGSGFTGSGNLPANEIAVQDNIFAGGPHITPSGYWGDQRSKPKPHKHDGIDYPVPKGTKIYPIAYGKVTTIVRTNSGSGYGIHVIVDHGNGLTSLYGHLSEVALSLYEGQIVFTGTTLLGLSGNTGFSYGKGGGYHLHLMVHKDGKSIDPDTIGRYQTISGSAVTSTSSRLGSFPPGVYTPGTQMMINLFTSAAKAAGVPKYWATSSDLYYIINHESGGNTAAYNASGASGIGQLLSGVHKIDNVKTYYPDGHAGQNDAWNQAVGMLKYIQARYTTLEKAYAFKRANGTY